MKNIYYIFLLLFLQLACKKDKPINSSALKDYWKPVAGIDYEGKNASYCYSNGKYLFIRSINYFYIFNAQNSLLQIYGYSGNWSYAYKVFPMAGNLFINLPHTLDIQYSWMQQLNFPSGFNLNSDTNLISFDNLTNFWEPAYILSPSGKIVIKAIDKSNKNNCTLLILDVFTPNVIKKIKTPFLSYDITLLDYSNGKFYFTDFSQNRCIYSMDSTGQYEKTAPFDFLKLCRTTTIQIGKTGYHQTYQSLDEGKNWSQVSDQIMGMNFINIDNRIINFWSSSIAEIKADGTDIQRIPYNSKGLEGNEITWICKHNDRYYCTTKSGVFYIEEEFFKPL